MIEIHPQQTHKYAPSLARPRWVRGALTETYYRKEWSQVSLVQEEIFEQLCLLTFQVGLGFETVLKHRSAIATALCNFDLDALANLTDEDLIKICMDPAVIRNLQKFRACRDNAQIIVKHEINLAQIFMDTFENYPSVSDYESLPQYCEESIELAKELAGFGIKFWGPTVLCSAAQALGLIRVIEEN